MADTISTEIKPSGVPAELRGIVKINYLNRDNTTLTEKNGFLGLRAVIDKPDDPLFDRKDEKKDENKDEKVHYLSLIHI